MSQVTVGTEYFGYIFSTNPGTQPYGFEYQGNNYQFVLANNGSGTTPTPGDYKIHAFKSSDQGATWNEVDSGNAVFVDSITSFGNCYTVCRDGSTAWIIYARTQFNPIGHPSIDILGVGVVAFDLASDTWGTPSNLSLATLDTMQQGSNPKSSRQIMLNLTRRGSGDMILQYSGTSALSAGKYYARVYYTTFDGSAFGSETILPGQTDAALYYYPSGVACDASGVTHFLFTAPNLANVHVADGFGIYHVAMSSGGSFGTPETVSTAGYFLRVSGTTTAPIVFTDSSVEYVALAACITTGGFALQGQQMFYAPTVGGTGALTWQNSIITQAVDTGADPAVLQYIGTHIVPQCISLAYANGTVCCGWTFTDQSFPKPPQDGFYYESHTVFAALSWSSPAISVTAADGTGSQFPAQEICAWTMSTGISLLCCSVGDSPASVSDANLGQFNMVPVSAPPTSVQFPTPGVGGGGCVPHCVPPDFFTRVEDIEAENRGGDPAVIASVLAALVITGAGQ